MSSTCYTFTVLKITVGSWSVIHSKWEHNYRLSLASPLQMYSKISPTKLDLLSHIHDVNLGLATMCIGTGQGIATILERIN